MNIYTYATRDAMRSSFENFRIHQRLCLKRELLAIAVAALASAVEGRQLYGDARTGMGALLDDLAERHCLDPKEARDCIAEVLSQLMAEAASKPRWFEVPQTLSDARDPDVDRPPGRSELSARYFAAQRFFAAEALQAMRPLVAAMDDSP